MSWIQVYMITISKRVQCVETYQHVHAELYHLVQVECYHTAPLELGARGTYVGYYHTVLVVHSPCAHVMIFHHAFVGVYHVNAMEWLLFACVDRTLHANGNHIGSHLYMNW